MTLGALAWAAIGAAWVVWLAATQLVRRLPGIDTVAHALLGSWMGRLVALAAWAEVGWHLFGQRP